MPQGFIVQTPQRLSKTSNGVLVPASGYLIYTYTVNTTTPKTTYSDGQLSSSNTNPVVTDADGYYRIFIAQGESVKCVVKTDADVQVLSFDYQQPMIADPAAGAVTAVPAGSMVFHGAATAPTGFLPCDGSPVSRLTYADLFAAISTTWGAGDGATTFNVPDMRGRFPLGKAASGTGSTFAGTGGTIDHVHTGPSHTHSVTVPRDGWGDASNVPATSGRIRTGDAAGTGTEASAEQATGDQIVTSAAGGTGNTGTANPPFAAGLWVIKT